MNGNVDDVRQHRGPPSPSPSCQYPVQQQPTDTANLEILQLPGGHPNYLINMSNSTDVVITTG